jgi:hypothetical protein
MRFTANPLLVSKMTDTLNPDVQALKEWLRGAWRDLANPNLTRFEQRELRNYMRDAERALRAGLKQIAARNMAQREVKDNGSPVRRIDFRILVGP